MARIKSNFGANSFGQAVNILIQLASVPIILAFWGQDLYGEWLIISAIPAYLALSDIGFGSVAANDMTIKFAKGDQKGALEVFQSTSVLIGLLSFCLFFFLVIVIYSFPFHDWLNLNVISLMEAQIVLVILAIQSFISLQLGLVHAGFRCIGAYAEGSIYLNLIRLFTFIGFILGIILEKSLINVVAISLLVQLSCTFIMVYLLFRKISWIRYGLSHVHVATLADLIKPAFAFMAIPLGHAINIQGMVLLIGTTLGASALVAFTLIRTLSRLVLQMTSIVNQSVWPEISKCFGESDFNTIQKIHRNAIKANLAISILASFFLVIFGDIIIELWSVNEVEFNLNLLLGLLLVLIVESLWNTSSVVLMAINKHQTMALLYVFLSILSIGLTVMLISIYGVLSACFSLLFVFTVLEVYTFKSVIKVTNDKINFFSFHR